MRLPLVALCLLSAQAIAAEERFVLPLPDDNKWTAHADVTYAPGLQFDLFAPKEVSAAPVAIFLNGIGASWIRKHVQYAAWARIVTTIGFAGVAMDSRPGHAAEDLDSLLAYLRSHASRFHVDPGRVVLYACSSNVQAGMPIAMEPGRTYLEGAVFYYGEGPAPSFRRDLPVFFVRAGLDEPNLNHNIDAMLARAYAANAPFTVVSFSGGHHGFEIRDDNDEARSIVAQTLQFMTSAVDPAIRSARLSLAAESAAAAALANRDWKAAVTAYSEVAGRHPADSEVQRRLGDALAGNGRFTDAVNHYRAALDLGSPSKGLLAYSAALASAHGGDNAAALDWIEKMGEYRSFFRAQLQSEPAFQSLRHDPRFVEMLK